MGGTAGRNLLVLFSRFDRDGSGVLEEHEFKSALRRTLRVTEAAVSDAEIATLFDMLDADSSGAIDINEMVAFLNAEADLVQLEQRERGAVDILQQLKASVVSMTEDLRCKTAAWLVDDACSKLTLGKVVEQPVLQRNTNDSSRGAVKLPSETNPRVTPPTRGTGERASPNVTLDVRSSSSSTSVVSGHEGRIDSAGVEGQVGAHADPTKSANPASVEYSVGAWTPEP